MTKNITPEQQKSIPEVWLAFALEMIRLDRDFKNKHKYPERQWQGWHWLWAIHRLKDKFPNFKPEQVSHRFRNTRPKSYIQFPDAPNEPPDAKDGFDLNYFEKILENLIKDLGNPKEINKIYFSYLNFRQDINFSNFIFPVETSFVGTHFVGNANFTDVEFLKGADFNDIQAHQDIFFPNGIFNKYVNFTGAHFYNLADFTKAQFLEDANFSISKFSAKADFKDAIFSARANFSKITFSGDVFFNKAQFSGDTIFEAVKFCTIANFIDAKFSSRVIFNKTKFSSSVRFIRAEFSYPVEFNNALFSSRAYFDSVKFLNGVTFTQAAFSDIAGFSNAQFDNIASFKNATFSGLTLFKSANFTATINFDNVRFEKIAPRFHDATLSADISWDRAVWPKIYRATDRSAVQQNQNTYENLANNMKRLEKYHDEHLFFRQEMRCRRKLERPLMKPFYWFYQLFADYGYGVGRAFSWWLGHIVLGVLVIALIALWGDTQFHKSLPCAIPVSFANANPYAFFGFESSSLKACYTKLDVIAPISFAIVKVIQTIFGIALLFLVLLTLRVRFRLK